MPEGYQTSIGTRCATSAAAPDPHRVLLLRPTRPRVASVAGNNNARAMPRRRRTDAILHRTAPSFLRDRSAHADDVRLHPRRRGHGALAPKPAREAGDVPRGHRTLPRRSRGGGRVHLHGVLAGGSVREGGDPLRARPRALHEGHPRGQGQERQDRGSRDRRAAARRDAASGLRLPGRDACDADLLRRRLQLVRKRGQLLAHLQRTTTPTTGPRSASASPIPRTGKASQITSRTAWYARASPSISGCSSATTR